MNVHFKPVGWDVYGYFEGSYQDKSPIDVVTVIRPHPMEESACVVGFIKGRLTNEMNILIGKKCAELGFKKMIFSRPAGDKATRHATFTHSADGLDWYAVDLTIFGG